jgi:hypothetical protein
VALANRSRSQTRPLYIRLIALNFSSLLTKELIERLKEPLIKTLNDRSRA